MFTNLFTILPLTCAIFVFLFGLFVLSKDSKSPMNRLMFAFSMSMTFWMFGTFMMFGTRLSNAAQSEFWDRFVYAGVVFMPPLMHHFSLIFTKRSGQRKLLFANYLLAFIFLIASRTRYFVDGLYIYDWGAHTRARVLHHVFLGYFFVGTGGFFYNIASYARSLKDKMRKLQAWYVFVAFAIEIFMRNNSLQRLFKNIFFFYSFQFE